MSQERENASQAKSNDVCRLVLKAWPGQGKLGSFREFLTLKLLEISEGPNGTQETWISPLRLVIGKDQET